MPTSAEAKPPSSQNVEAAMKKATERYYRVAPYMDAALRAMATQGKGIDKVDAGTSELANRLGMRFFNNIYQKALQKQYDRHPRFARFVDNHPVLFGFPLIITTSALCSYAGDLTRQGVNRLYQKYLRERIQNALASPTVTRLCQPFGSANTWINAGLKHPGFKVALAGASLASSLAFVTHIALNTKPEKKPVAPQDAPRLPSKAEISAE
jgi:hypothetical protein